MKSPTPFLLLLAVAPVFAQPQIGGGTCSTIALNGTYMMTLTGRQLNSSAAYVNVLQAAGSATFDGQSKVTLSLAQNTLKGTAAALAYSGTYTVQANCLGALTLTSGDTASFNLLIYNQGNDFLLAGSDATYNFTGGGSVASANSCATSKLAGVYSLNGSGYSLSSVAVTGVENATGLAEFDGKGGITVNLTPVTASGAAASTTLSGTYSIPSSCLGTAALTDAGGNSYSVAFAATSVSSFSVNGFDMLIGEPGKLTLSGAGHALYGQPVVAIDPLPLVPATRSPRGGLQ